MNVSRSALVGAILLAWMALPAVSGEDAEQATRFADLRSSDNARRSAAAQEIFLERQRLVDELQAIVRQNADREDKRSREITLTAVGLLGQLRAAEAVPTLVQHLTLRSFVQGDDPRTSP